MRAFYFLYLGGVGVTLPFLPPYLRGLGLSGQQVSLVLALTSVCHLAGVPLAWGWAADRLRRPALVLRVAVAGALFAFVPMLAARGLAAVAACYAAYAFFQVPIIGLVDALAVERVRAGADYGRLRAWGSFGFVAASLLAGQVLAARGNRAADPAVVVVFLVLLGASLLAAFTLRAPAHAGERPHARDLRDLLRDRRFTLALAAASLHWAFMGPFNAFLGVHIRDLGLSSSVVGLAFAAGVGAEVLALVGFRRVRAALSLEAWLALSYAVTALRWALMAGARSAVAIAALQTLHAFTFAFFWAASIALVGEAVPPRIRATGQAVFTVGVFGAGNALGYLGAGALYDRLGGAAPTFAVAAIGELLPLALALLAGRHAGARAAVSAS